MTTRELLEELLSQRILLDGTIGAFIFSRKPGEENYTAHA